MSETATSPVHLFQLFAERASAGEIDSLIELYQADAVFEDNEGVVHIGREQIKDALAPLLDLKPQISYEGDMNVITVGGTALVSGVWSMTGTTPDGSTVSVAGISADVIRRQNDGSWQILIDQPRGAPTNL